MNHKHVEVVIEAMVYSREIDAQDAINDICDYIECVEAGDGEKHYKQCLLDKEGKI